MMKIHQRNKLICLIALVFVYISMPLLAQETYKYKAGILKIDSDGVYKIELNPDIIAKSLYNLHDIRLIDNNGKNVAYALGNILADGKQVRFIDFPQINTNAGNDTTTIYIVENKNKLTINHLWLRLKNTAVNRAINFTGSDDGKKWFAIKEDMQLQEADSGSEPDYEQVLNFPSSDYRYFKIQVNGKNKAPINVLRSGIYITPGLTPPYYEALSVKFKIQDTKKVTKLYILFKEPYLINKLHLDIASPKYYSRNIAVYALENKNEKQIINTIINSSGLQDVLLSVKTTRLRIDIINGDDNALNIKSVMAYQQKQFIISYLEARHNYYLLTGYSLASEVNYDLSFLKSQLVSSLPIIKHSAVYANPAYKITIPIVKRDYTLLIWVAITIALLLLSILTWSMIREISLKK